LLSSYAFSFNWRRYHLELLVDHHSATPDSGDGGGGGGAGATKSGGRSAGVLQSSSAANTSAANTPGAVAGTAGVGLGRFCSKCS